jgi:hypothetical protein
LSSGTYCDISAVTPQEGRKKVLDVIDEQLLKNQPKLVVT